MLVYDVKLRALVCIVSLTVAVCGCRSRGSSSPVIARLNKLEVHRDEFEQFLASKIGDLNGSDVSDAIRSQMLDDYLKRRLVLDEASKAGLSVTGAEIDQSAEDNPQIKSSVASGAREEIG